ncbi:MAG: extracellular solute-binding protein [Lachnospiraceae bacterium]|nr:extracellular solute-binding protein [Lachnospiraceae bacterium]
MKKMKKTLAVILAAAMTFSLAACGGEKAEETPQPQPDTAPAENQSEAPSVEETEERDPVAIQFMHSMVEEERQQTIQGLIDKFEEEYSWITVEQVPVDGDSAYDTKLTAFAGGGMPAVIEVNQNRAKWLVGNELADLDAIREVIESKSGEYYDAILKINTTEDGQNFIGVPVGGWVQGIWYNKTAFEEKGLEAPDTWDNILAAAETFYDPDNKKYGIALPTVDGSFSEQSFSQFALSVGANALNADGEADFNSDKMIKALTFYKELYQYSIQGSNGTTEVKDALLNGSVPMGIYSTYILKDLINEGMMDDFGFALVTGENSASYGSVGMLSISEGLNDEEREAAVLFVKFLVEKENNIEWLHMAPGGQQPVMPAVADDPAYLDNEIIKGFEGLSSEISAAFGSISLFGIVDGRNFVSMGDITSSNVISRAIYDLTVNGKEPADVADETQKQIEALISE